MKENLKTKRKINPINFVGGALLVISALFLPWVNLQILGGAKHSRNDHITSYMIKYFSYIASGYYIAWIGAIVALLSNKIYEKVV